MKRLLPLVLLLAACSGGTGSDSGEAHLTEADLAPWQEARSYLAERHGVWLEGISLEEVGQFVEDCYAAGSPRVMFAGIVDLDGARVSAWIVVEMPAAGSQRAAVLRAFNAVAAPYEQAEADTGQRFLDLATD